MGPKHILACADTPSFFTPANCEIRVNRVVAYIAALFLKEITRWQ